MSPAVIYTYGGGRLGNQLLNYANLLAFSLEHEEFEVLDLAFFPYYSEYGNETFDLASLDGSNLPGIWDGLIKGLWTNDRINRLVSRTTLGRFRNQLVHLVADKSKNTQSIIAGDPPHIAYPLIGRFYDSYRLSGVYLDKLRLEDERTVERLRSKELSALAGWGVRGWPLIRRHRDTIRERLKPGKDYQSAGTQYIKSLRDEFDVLIGVLIRQRDYRLWNDGKYFFGSSRYRHWMNRYASTLENSNVGFVIASDEPQAKNIFSEDKFRFATGKAVGPNHFLENFVELSQCDTLMTPPSTFATLSAFLGDTPIVPLYPGVEEEGWSHLTDPLFDALTHPHLSEAVH